MSSFDPLAALGLDAVAAAQQAIAEATLNLGVPAALLQAQISVGDVIPATILTPAGGNDLLSFLGQTVIASLPQGVYPGETLALQVTGFSGNQILVRNLGVADPNNLPAPIAIEPPQAGTPTSAVLQSAAPLPQPEPAAPAPSGASPSEPVPLLIPTRQGVPPPAIPPPAPPPPAGSAPPGGLAPPPSVFAAAALRAGSPPPTPPNPPNAPTAAPIPVQAAIEARIAATRAAAADAGARLGIATDAEQGTAPAGTAPNAAVQARIARADGERPAIVMRAPSSPIPLQARSPEQSLLARLRIPLTDATVAAARLIGDGARSIPRVFAELERVLAGVPAGDPRVPSLRALMSFSGRLDPANTRALAEQLASFVSNVLDGRESKFAAIVRALSAREQPAEVPSASEPSAQGPVASGSRATLAQAEPSVAPAIQPAMQAQVAERIAALEFDVKSAVMALIQSPPPGAPAGLPGALGNALSAITALQMNVLNAQHNDPSAILVSLPVFYRDGGAPTQLRIARDARNGKHLDGDTFHVAFVLDTKTLGTVAIDLQSAGRAVSVSVKTERSGAAQRFRSTLGDLRSRLEHLRYRVAAIAADVAPIRAAQESAPTPSAEAGEPPSGQLDLRA